MVTRFTADRRMLAVCHLHIIAFSPGPSAVRSGETRRDAWIMDPYLHHEKFLNTGKSVYSTWLQVNVGNFLNSRLRERERDAVSTLERVTGN